MMQQGQRRLRVPVCRLIGAIVVVVAALSAGCKVAPARFQIIHPHESYPRCTTALAGNIVQDSLVQLACHPWQTSLEFVCEPVQEWWTMSRGAIGKRLIMPIQHPPAELVIDRATVDGSALCAHLDQLLEDKTVPANIVLSTDGFESLRTIEHLIEHARSSIDVMMFQWENDALGADLASQLAAKAGPHLRVRILVDGGGNLIFGRPTHSHADDVNAVVSQLAARPHVELIRTRIPFGRMDHRKLMIVDGIVAWTGGRNFTHKSFFDQRDISYTIRGPLVQELSRTFESFWCEQGGAPSSEAMHVEPVESCPAPNAQARLICTSPKKHHFEKAMYDVIDHAQHHIFMENYTFCDGLLVYKLAQARRRGVDVRIVLTFSDCTEALNRANRVIANRLRDAGVRVFVYPGMTHAKVAVVDGCWAYLGTGNFDPLSLRKNHELGVAIGPGPLVAELEQRIFGNDLRPEWELREALPLTTKDYLCEMMASFCL